MPASTGSPAEVAYVVDRHSRHHIYHRRPGLVWGDSNTDGSDVDDGGAFDLVRELAVACRGSLPPDERAFLPDAGDTASEAFVVVVFVVAAFGPPIDPVPACCCRRLPSSRISLSLRKAAEVHLQWRGTARLPAKFQVQMPDHYC